MTVNTSSCLIKSVTSLNGFIQLRELVTSSKIVPMHSDLFPYLNRVKHVCKQIELHVYILDTT